MFKSIINFFSSKKDNSLQMKVKDNPFLVDVRTPQEFAGGSVKGAVNIPLDILPNQLAKFKNKSNIIVFCRSGNRSGQAKTFLEQNGIGNITNGGSWENVKQAIND